MKKAKALYFLMIIVAFTSCKSYKSFISTDIKKIEKDQLIDNVIKSNESEYYSIKYSAKYNDGKKKQNINGLLRIKTDSIIWLSLGPSIGVELFRVIITNDSLKFINKTNNTYYTGSVDYLSKLIKVDVNYNMLESVLLAKLFAYNSNDDLNDYYKSSSIDSNYYVLSNTIKGLMSYFSSREINNTQMVFVHPIDFTIYKGVIQDKELKRDLKILYSEYQNINSKLYPYKIQFDYEDLNTNVSLNIKYQKFTVRETLKFPFRISKKYIRL